jgi:hypothetical protein
MVYYEDECDSMVCTKIIKKKLIKTIKTDSAIQTKINGLTILNNIIFYKKYIQNKSKFKAHLIT